MPRASSSVLTSTRHMNSDERFSLSNEDQLAFALHLFGKLLHAGYGGDPGYSFIIDEIRANDMGVPAIKFWWRTNRGHSRSWSHTTAWNSVVGFEMWEADDADH